LPLRCYVRFSFVSALAAEIAERKRQGKGIGKAMEKRQQQSAAGCRQATRYGN